MTARPAAETVPAGEMAKTAKRVPPRQPIGRARPRTLKPRLNRVQSVNEPYLERLAQLFGPKKEGGR